MTHVQRFLLRLLKEAAPMVILLALLSGLLYCLTAWPAHTLGAFIALAVVIGLTDWLSTTWKATKNDHD